jgi:hypothetical protein
VRSHALRPACGRSSSAPPASYRAHAGTTPAPRHHRAACRCHAPGRSPARTRPPYRPRSPPRAASASQPPGRSRTRRRARRAVPAPAPRRYGLPPPRAGTTSRLRRNWAAARRGANTDRRPSPPHPDPPPGRRGAAKSRRIAYSVPPHVQSSRPRRSGIAPPDGPVRQPHGNAPPQWPAAPRPRPPARRARPAGNVRPEGRPARRPPAAAAPPRTGPGQPRSRKPHPGTPHPGTPRPGRRYRSTSPVPSRVAPARTRFPPPHGSTVQRAARPAVRPGRKSGYSRASSVPRPIPPRRPVAPISLPFGSPAAFRQSARRLPAARRRRRH